MIVCVVVIKKLKPSCRLMHSCARSCSAQNLLCGATGRPSMRQNLGPAALPEPLLAVDSLRRSFSKVSSDAAVVAEAAVDVVSPAELASSTSMLKAPESSRSAIAPLAPGGPDESH